MQCAYCLSAIEDDANVCKVCKRDVYLFRPLLAKVQELEEKLAEHQSAAELQARVEELEALLLAEQLRHEQTEAVWLRALLDVCQFIFIPLALLLLAHALITVVYDINLLYLRVTSMILPMPFGYYLFKNRKRHLVAWFLATAGLAATSVVGMSAITAWVDHTPVLPQSLVEWREFLEYASSITFSFLTGMLIGGMAYHRTHQARTHKKMPFLSVLVTGFAKGNMSPADLQKTIKKLEDVGGSLVAAGTTAMSIYTGLKAFM
jgi:hypothetical protein